MIRLYTREAGVRNLEREIAKLARKTVTRIVSDDAASVNVTPENIEEFLGVSRFRFGEIEATDQVGVTTGLAGQKWAANCCKLRRFALLVRVKLVPLENSAM